MRKYTARYTEAGRCRRPYCVGLGSPTMREAHCEQLRRHGRRMRPEAMCCVPGKPGGAGGPVMRAALITNRIIRRGQVTRLESARGG